MSKWSLRALLGLTGATALVMAGMIAEAPATPAQASGTCTISVPNISITSTNMYNVKGTLNNCGAASASWDMDTGSNYSQTIDMWWFYNTTTEYAYYVPGVDPLGNYKAVGTGAWDSDYNQLPQSDTYFKIKLGTRIGISGYRSGNYVYVRAHVKRYSTSANWGLGGWINSANRLVKFYRHSSSGWLQVGYKYTGSNGYTAYRRVYSPSHRYFRARVTATTRIWGATSSRIYR